MKFIKENPALAAGIGLPFLLVILFSLANVVTKIMVEPPKHDLYFTIQDSRCTNGDAKVQFYFAEGKIKAKYMHPKPQNNYVNCYDNEQLYHFDAKTMTSRQITFSTPSKKNDSEEWYELDIPELQLVQLDNTSISPDGYRFDRRNIYYRGGIFPFDGYYGSQNGVAIVKNGRVINISPMDKDRYYYINQAEALGWVVAP